MGLFKNRKVVLALGGGGARGFANIGVLKALKNANIPIDLIIGSSMGAMVGASYSLGMSIQQLEDEAVRFSWRDITDLTIPHLAALKGEKLEQTINRLTGGKTFEDCMIPMAVTATNIQTGDELIYTSGNLQKIVLASCSWPGFFPPVEVDGKLLADGGIRNSVPVKWAKKLGGTFVIAVKLGFSPQKIDATNIFQLMIQSVQIMGEELDKYQSLPANAVIEPNLKDFNQLDFHEGAAIMKSGEEAAGKILKKIKRALGVR